MELCSCAYRSTTATSNGSTSCLTRLSSRSQSRLVLNQCLSSLVKFSSRFSQSFQSSSLLLSPFIFWVITSLYLLPLSTQYTSNLTPSNVFISTFSYLLKLLHSQNLFSLSSLCYRPSLSFYPLPYSQTHTQNPLFALVDFICSPPFFFPIFSSGTRVLSWSLLCNASLSLLCL